MKVKSQKFKRGSALLLAVLIITSMLLMLLGISRLIIPQLNQNRELIDASIANYAAKAGIAFIKQDPMYFLSHDSHSISLDSGNPCDGSIRTERCIKMEAITEPGTGDQKKFKVAIITLTEDQPLINQGLFATMNRMLKESSNTQVKDVIGSADYEFINPHPRSALSLPEECPYWIRSLGELLDNPSILSDYNLLYLTNGTVNLSGSGNDGKLDLRPFFKRSDRGGYKATLGDFLKTGGHLFIDNAWGAKVIFPTQAEFNNSESDYYDSKASETRLDKIGFQWSENPTDAYKLDNPSTYPVFINTGNPTADFNGSEGIFKYVYKYDAMQPTPDINKTFSWIQDYTLKSNGSWVDRFFYIDPEKTRDNDNPLSVGTNSGYTEMAAYSNTNHANIAMQFFGTGPWGWIVISSSSPGTAVTAQGANEINACNTNAPQDAKIIAPYMFVFSIADFATKLKSIKLIGYYGGIQRAYFAQPTYTASGIKISWVEIPG